MKAKNFLILMVAFALGGCASTPPPAATESPALLSFLADGKTTRAETILTLGQPSGRFEAGKIVTYRLNYFCKNNTYHVMERQTHVDGWPTWYSTQFSLVLIFNGEGVLQKHSLVKVNQ